MSTPELLDANALIALVVEEHEHHERAVAWAGRRALALCPIVEGALLRFLVRSGERPADALEVLGAVRDRDGLEWWPDDVPYSAIDSARLTGHRQLTDAYLVALAQARGSRLATLDTRLVAVHGASALLIPESQLR